VTPAGEGSGSGGGPFEGLVFKHEIAADTAISGKIHFPGDARIDGRLKGEVRADALLVVGPAAVLHASVRADRLILLGTVQGELVCARVAELHRGSRLVGNLEAERLVVHAGAVLEGRCLVGHAQAPPANAPKVILLERPIHARGG
jgi:cytoskeletal protein CcmA (bactofilin family)